MAAAALLAFALFGRDLLESALRESRYVTKAQVDVFPAVGTNVKEQRVAELGEIAWRYQLWEVRADAREAAGSGRPASPAGGREK